MAFSVSSERQRQSGVDKICIALNSIHILLCSIHITLLFIYTRYALYTMTTGDNDMVDTKVTGYLPQKEVGLVGGYTPS